MGDLPKAIIAFVIFLSFGIRSQPRQMINTVQSTTNITPYYTRTPTTPHAIKYVLQTIFSAELLRVSRSWSSITHMSVLIIIESKILVSGIKYICGQLANCGD